MDPSNLKEEIPGNKEELKNSCEVLRSEYSLDKTEFGRFMVVVSTILLVVSVHSVVVLDSTVESIGESTHELEGSHSILSDDDFQSAINSLGGIQGSDVDQQIAMVAEGFNDAEAALDELKETEEDLEESKTMYQWLVVTGIAGMVAGLSVIFV